MVGKAQLQRRVGQWPLTPLFAALGVRFERNQPAVSQRDYAAGEAKLVVEVNRQCYQNVFRDCETVFQRR
ncbi:hypothetical protein QTI51_00350 [Variovorax sp. J22G73]|uniref:hypothetical protein n=1 Tax=unclassified Variovorax TaxID=663243 RepID=UPI002577CA69|nr:MULTISPECIES: hypothetical protein [unclassified Variovorax]MDM0004630.1 hypothetical protein [Variovorax sp. J22R203]MDM0095704.1 hypothetical protein [Variovorax sp. J22G73]